MLSIMGVSTPMLFREKTCPVNCGCEHTHTVQRQNLSCCAMWVSAHPYFKGETFRAVHCGCEHTHAVLERNPSVLSIVGVSTPILFREETFCAVHCECQHTHIVQRGNLSCCPLWVSAHQYCSERKPSVLSIVGVSTPILQRANLLCCPLWVSAHPYCSEETCAVHCGCQPTHTVQRENLSCQLWV